MDKKATSKPMVAILTRLNLFADFHITTFGDDLILNKPVSCWPEVDCLISFFSEGFPLDKAEAYVRQERGKNPNFMCLNDVEKQFVLHDRRSVYRTLISHQIPVTRFIEVTREPPLWDDPDGFEETEDAVTLDGTTIMKPFVEKPVDGEDHNVWIYYPGGLTDGEGGVKKLFRKKGNKSSEFYPDHPGKVRRQGSYMYERFMQTGGTDVKVYTVGPHYAHAEARKSPVVDGFVERFPDGKEIRYPVLLTPAEKEIAKKVNIAFGQFVCGFDLLRSEGKSYVCDVNGWSFVKNSEKYYADAADIVRHHILHQLTPHRDVQSSQANSNVSSSRSIPIVNRSQRSYSEVVHSDDMCGSPNYFSLVDGRLPSFMQGEKTLSYDDLTSDGLHPNRLQKSRHELRAIIAVIRHGDRTPKQKMKVKVTQKPLLDLMKKCGGGYVNGKLKQTKLKKPDELQDLLDIIREILNENSSRLDTCSPIEGCSDDEEKDFLHKMRLARTILERGGKFSGINRKVQLKPLQVKYNGDGGGDGDDTSAEVTEALMIIKHGGILTDCGKKQSEELGARFRKQMYPQGKEGEGDGLLRLHSTYRHDLKIYSSDEGRVQVSAAAFTKGLLDLEGQSLVPIMTSLVNKDQQILDAFGKGVDETMQQVKIRLQCAITGGVSKMILPKFASEPKANDSSSDTVVLSQSPRKSGKNVVEVQGEDVEGVPENSIEILEEIAKCIRSLCDSMLKKLQAQDDYTEQEDDNMSQDQFVMDYERWKVLMLTFCKRGRYNISMIPEIYDSAKYDLIQKKSFLDPEILKRVYTLSKKMADIVVPNEYGITNEDRWDIGSRICSELLGKLCRDFSYMRQMSISDNQIEEEEEEDEDDDEAAHSTRITHRLAAEFAEDIKTPERHVRTRIYFTSESHIHALINVLRYGTGPNGLGEKESKPLLSEEGLRILEETSEFDYLSQVVFRVFENLAEPPDSPARFTLDILFSPGCVGEPFNIAEEGGFLPPANLVSISDHFISVAPTTMLTELEALIYPYATHKRKESFFGHHSPFNFSRKKDAKNTGKV